MPILTQYMGTLNSILQQCLGSNNADVALAAMRATTAFIQELEDNQDRDKFQVERSPLSSTWRPSQQSLTNMLS